MGKTYTFGDNYDINAPENCSAVFNKNLGIGVKHIEKPKRKKDKETEKKIKEIVKDINSRKTYYEKARKAHKKDKDISGIYFCVGLLSQCDRDLELIKGKFPEYFKDSDKL